MKENEPSLDIGIDRRDVIVDASCRFFYSRMTLNELESFIRDPIDRVLYWKCRRGHVPEEDNIYTVRSVKYYLNYEVDSFYFKWNESDRDWKVEYLPRYIYQVI